MNTTTGGHKTTKVRRWNPVAKHDHNKGGAHRDKKKHEKKYQSRDKGLTKSTGCKDQRLRGQQATQV